MKQAIFNAWLDFENIDYKQVKGLHFFDFAADRLGVSRA
jgi:hypothetical protein